jgi:transcriptional antiterminator
MDNGFIKIHRSLNEWGWKKDPKMVAFWMHILVNANWKDGHFMGHKISAGDIVIGRKALSHETGLSEREIRTCIDKLKMTGEVTSKTTNRFTILTIVKWEQYQVEREQATSSQSNKRPTSDQQATTIEEGKKERIIKDISNDISKSDAFLLPDWIPSDLWNEHQAIRRKLKAQNTDRAKELLIAKLEQYSIQGHDIRAIMETSIENSWKSFFEPKGTQHERHNNNNQPSAFASGLAQFAAKE